MSSQILQIGTDERFAPSLRYIVKRLNSLTRRGVIATSLLKKSNRSDLVVSLTDTTEPDEKHIQRVGAIALDALSDIIINDCKFHYINTSLRLPMIDDVNRHAFVRALTSFDAQTDKIIAKSLINLTPSFLLDSFYTFCIDDLKTRWQEVIALANENIGYLVCGNTFNELLRFLISNIESREREVHIFQDGETLQILNGGLRQFKDLIIDEDLSPDIKAITQLIQLAPKRIYLHRESQTPDAPVVGYIQSLFQNCVCVNEQ
jgi:hypothetical protein